MIGNADGLHIGHRALIERTISEAADRGLTSAVMTFAPHTAARLGVRTLMTADEKLSALSGTGVGRVISVAFDDAFMALSPREFAAMLAGAYHVRAVVVGETFRFGKDRAGDVSALRGFGAELGFDVVAAETVALGGEAVSSSRARRAVCERRFELASELLGAPYYLSGTVVAGRRVGRDLGFPTANTEVFPDKLYPPNGVYITSTTIGGSICPSVTNIGVRPTFAGAGGFSVETYIIGYGGDAYGLSVKTAFHGFIRDEERFAGEAELRDRIALDVTEAKSYFETRDERCMTK
jgi:riboflavin kinase/FMN adenylyltransferase